MKKSGDRGEVEGRREGTEMVGKGGREERGKGEGRREEGRQSR